MAKKITEEEIKKINELYQLYGTYSAVAKEVGRAPSTVKKYIDIEYVIDATSKEVDWAQFDELRPIKLTSETCELKESDYDIFFSE